MARSFQGCRPRPARSGILTVVPAVSGHRGREPFIAPRGVHTPPRSCIPSADTPMSRSSASNPLPRDRGQLHILDMSERTPENYRSRPGSGPNSRRNRERLVSSRAADTHSRFGLLPILPPTSPVAWRRDADRIMERIVVWTP